MVVQKTGVSSLDTDVLFISAFRSYSSPLYALSYLHHVLSRPHLRRQGAQGYLDERNTFEIFPGRTRLLAGSLYTAAPICNSRPGDRSRRPTAVIRASFQLPSVSNTLQLQVVVEGFQVSYHLQWFPSRVAICP